jgi:hypothetical protein
MNELLDRAKVIHNEKVLYKVKKPTKNEILKKEAEDRLTSSRRVQEFMQLMKKHSIPIEDFWGSLSWSKGWIVREPYYFDNDNHLAPGIAILKEYSAVYMWKWSEDGKTRELRGFSQDSLFFSRESNFTILCERIIELKIV